MTTTDPDRLSRRAPARPARAGARAAAELRTRISGGHLAPGTKLAELEVAGALGISRNTLREAFAQLEAESLVAKIPHRGVFVARPGAEDVQEIYRTRLIIEPAAVLWAEPTEELASRVDAALETAWAAQATGNIRGVSDANQLFHRSLVAMTGSATLLTVMDRLLARMRLVFHARSSRPDFHGHYLAGNARVWGMIIGNRRAEAADTLREYLGRARDELLEHI